MTRNVILMVVISLIISAGFTGIASTMLKATGRVSITDITADRQSVQPGGKVRLHAEAKESAGGSLSYTWKADGGKIAGFADGTMVWTSPSEEGRYHLGVTVVNVVGSNAEASTDIIVSKYSRSGPS